MQASLAALAAAIQSIQQQASPRPTGSCDPESAKLQTGWPAIDDVLGGGLRQGAVHEWFTDIDAPAPHAPHASYGPVAILAHLASRAIHQANPPGARSVLWIGNRCWPYPGILICGGDRLLLHRSVFIDPTSEAARWWAIEQTLRSPTVGAVIADGRGLDMTQSRRLQLAAESGRAVALLSRPMGELDQLSAASTRWRVEPEPARTLNPRWTVRLMRCKGMRPCEARPCWALEWDRAKGLVNLPADVADRPDQASQAEERFRQSA